MPRSSHTRLTLIAPTTPVWFFLLLLSSAGLVGAVSIVNAIIRGFAQ